MTKIEAPTNCPSGNPLHWGEPQGAKGSGNTTRPCPHYHLQLKSNHILFRTSHLPCLVLQYKRQAQI